MTIAVDLGRKATKQTNKSYFKVLEPIKLILNIYAIISGYSQYGKLKYYELQ